MTNSTVSEEEIDAAEKLRAKGDFATSLRLTQDMLACTQDGDLRMRLLFNVVSCSAMLQQDEITSHAMEELDEMPQPEFSRALANMSRAYAEDQLGRPEKALALLDMNLETGYFEREDFRIHKYQLCLFKGQALLRLRRAEEASNGLIAHMLSIPQKRARVTRRTFASSAGLNRSSNPTGRTASWAFPASMKRLKLPLKSGKKPIEIWPPSLSSKWPNVMLGNLACPKPSGSTPISK
jgi:hypothetical protein